MEALETALDFYRWALGAPEERWAKNSKGVEYSVRVTRDGHLELIGRASNEKFFAFSITDGPFTPTKWEEGPRPLKISNVEQETKTAPPLRELIIETFWKEIFPEISISHPVSIDGLGVYPKCELMRCPKSLDFFKNPPVDIEKLKNHAETNQNR